MKTMKVPSKAFTLIEVIITLVVVSVLGVFVYQYLGSSLFRSSEPMERLKQSLSLQQIAENMTADYKKHYVTKLPDFKAKIENPTTSGYGSYTVVESKYVKFLGNQETNADPGVNNMLKVKIENSQNETVTLLFIAM